MVADPRFGAKRAQTLRGLDLEAVDPPMIDIVVALSRATHCFTLQCCHGHFLRGPDELTELAALAELPPETTITYRLAYLAVCVEPGPRGEGLLADLRGVAASEPALAQFGCADWFWRRWVNSYVLQVEPERFKLRDAADMGVDEALRVWAARDRALALVREIALRHGPPA